MTDPALKHLEHARQVTAYFARRAEVDPLFEPERDVARKILELMEGPRLPDAAVIEGLLNSLQMTEHYNGSGWLDFQMAVHAWVRAIEGRSR